MVNFGFKMAISRLRKRPGRGQKNQEEARKRTGRGQEEARKGNLAKPGPAPRGDPYPKTAPED